MRYPIFLAHGSPGSFIAMLVIGAALVLVLFCLFVASALRITESRCAVRHWYIIAGVIVIAGMISVILIIRFLD